MAHNADSASNVNRAERRGITADVVFVCTPDCMMITDVRRQDPEVGVICHTRGDEVSPRTLSLPWQQ